LLALIRKKLAESDAQSGETRVILGKEEIIDMVGAFFTDSANSAKIADRISTSISKVVELGFLRRLKGKEERFEISRILKTFVDAQWLQEFETRLAEYRNHGMVDDTSENETTR
jgi:hypothetical protein